MRGTVCLALLCWVAFLKGPHAKKQNLVLTQIEIILRFLSTDRGSNVMMLALFHFDIINSAVGYINPFNKLPCPN